MESIEKLTGVIKIGCCRNAGNFAASNAGTRD